MDGHRFDITFNPLKTQTTVLGGLPPPDFVLNLNEAAIDLYTVAR